MADEKREREPQREHPQVVIAKAFVAAIHATKDPKEEARFLEWLESRITEPLHDWMVAFANDPHMRNLSTFDAMAFGFLMAQFEQTAIEKFGDYLAKRERDLMKMMKRPVHAMGYHPNATPGDMFTSDTSGVTCPHCLSILGIRC